MTQVLHSAYHFLGDIIPVTITAEVTDGIGIHVIGIPDAAVKEGLLRVVTAIQSLGYHIPGKKIVIDVEPHGGKLSWAGAYRPSECAQAFDVAIALAILMASGQMKALSGKQVDDVLFFGKLTLDGKLAAPFQGFDNDQDAALVLEYQLRHNWEAVYGYPATYRSIWVSVSTLPEIIEAIEANDIL